MKKRIYLNYLLDAVLIAVILMTLCSCGNRLELTNKNDGGQKSVISINNVRYRILHIDEKENTALLFREGSDCEEVTIPVEESCAYSGSFLDQYYETDVYQKLREFLGDDAIPETILYDSLTKIPQDDGISRHVFALALEDVFSDFRKLVANEEYGFYYICEKYRDIEIGPFVFMYADECNTTEGMKVYPLRTAGTNPKRFCGIASDGAWGWLKKSRNISGYYAREAFTLDLNQVNLIKTDEHVYRAEKKS